MISVLMSVYNERLDWLKEAINSILIQSIDDFEFIIVIDNPNIPSEYLSYLNSIAASDSRIKLIFNEKNVGLAKSLNIALANAKGEYIARMDADDISLNDRLKVELDCLTQHNADMVSANKIIIDGEGNEISRSPEITQDPNKYLPFSTLIVHPTVLIRTNVIKELNGYRNFQRSQDYDLWLRMLTSGRKIVILNEYLLKYRVRSNSITNKNRLEQFYINEYQKKLYYERKKKGKDSFSEQNLRKFLLTKGITDRKNKRCIYTMQKLETAQKFMADRKLLFIILLFEAFISFPEIVFRISLNKFKKYMI